jgi:hypothetical protein
MPATWLDGFKGQHVTVVTTAGPEERTDTGTLVQLAEGWIQLAKDSGDMLLIPNTAIRLVKLLEMGGTVPALPADALNPVDSGIHEPGARTL